MQIHPKARPLFSKLSLPDPLKNSFSTQRWTTDLTKNTNPHLDEMAIYPDIRQDELKKIYLEILLSLNPPPYFQEKDQDSFSEDNILFTAGSLEGLDLVVKTFIEPHQDLICVPTPTFSAYEHWALIHGVPVIRIPLLGKNLDQMTLQDIFTINPKLVIVCNPNNPTGTHLRPEIIPALCESLSGLVVVDEAYIEYSNLPSSIFYLKKYDNLIVLRSFSKAWGLAGARGGALISSPSIIHTLRHVQLPYSFSALAQEKVKDRLLNSKSVYDSWKINESHRSDMISKISLLPGVVKVFRSETNFLMIVLRNFQRTLDFLKDQGICVLDCSRIFPNSIRVSIGTAEQNQAFLEAMERSSYA